MLFAGLIGQLNPDAFSLLMKLQNKMASVIKTVGNIEHEVYPLTEREREYTYLDKSDISCLKNQPNAFSRTIHTTQLRPSY